MKNYKEYKKFTPERTINNIRTILTDLNILLLDSNANRDNIFACRVVLGNQNLNKLQIGMNGKGSTFEYALASGYAEFMEKIQNRFLCDHTHTFYGTKRFIDTLPEDSKFRKRLYGEDIALDFRYDEREEYWNLDQVLNTFGDELMLLYHANSREELKSVISNIIGADENHILMIPCFSQKDNSEVFIPIDLILPAVGSNGMTAGNTESEALLHGFCEIFERYALKTIYYNQLTPPTIPIEDFADTPVYTKIKYLVDVKGYEIIIKDCSLGLGLPVYGVIIIDKKNHVYNFKLGSEHVPYIAVDRCLNEAYQSTDGFIGVPTNFSWSNPLGIPVNEATVNANYHRILESGSGLWPQSILYSTPSYEYAGEDPRIGLSNETDLQHCFEVVKKLGFNVYIRNNSITDFPSYYIIIPGMNQVLYSQQEYENKFGKGILAIMRAYPRLIDMTPDEVKELAGAIESRINNGYFFDLTHDYFLYNTDEGILNLNIHIFLCILFYYAEDFPKSKLHLDKYIKSKSSKSPYLHAFSDFIQFAKIDNIPINEVKLIMNKIHDEGLTYQIVQDMSDPQLILYQYDFPTCFKCENCKVEKTCQFFKMIRIENEVNKLAVKNGISYKQILKL